MACGNKKAEKLLKVWKEHPKLRLAKLAEELPQERHQRIAALLLEAVAEGRDHVVRAARVRQEYAEEKPTVNQAVDSHSLNAGEIFASWNSKPATSFTVVMHIGFVMSKWASWPSWNSTGSTSFRMCCRRIERTYASA